MRFIYIDSHGKEVSIPTVDALALRIELGAINESTRLYDEAADRWAPAREHEIFRQLLRERQDKSEGFVAPPPPPAPAPPPAAAAPPAPVPPPRSSDPFGLDFGLTMQAAPPEPEPEPVAEDRAEDDSFEIGAESAPDFGQAELDEPPTEAAPPARKKDASLDFSGFGGMLTDDDDGDGDEDEADEDGQRAPPPDSGMVVEGVFSGSGYDQPADQGSEVVGGGMDLEQPLSDLPVDAQGWMPRERLTSHDDDEGDGDAGGDGDDETRRPRLSRQRAAPLSTTPEKKVSPLPALIGAAVVIAVVGGGSWFGWSQVKSRRAAAAVAAAEALDPPVAIPAISAALEPRMRELADSAQADWLTALRTVLPAQMGVPLEPDGDWLAGIYLADAGNYPGVEQYWTALDGLLTQAESNDVDSFGAFYQTRLDSAGITGDDARAMLDRAKAGFLAGRTERRVVYQRLRNVIDSALGLHQFLVANADQIEYDPAAGGASRDPVLEAVPATPVLGEEMWAEVDKITASLDALGALDKVTTDRLLDLATARLREVYIR